MTDANVVPAAGRDAAGTIRFVEHALPAIAAGEYRIEVDHEIRRPGIGSSGSDSFHARQHFHVRGPRFGLLPTDVHAVYPPANTDGHYADTMAHIVLRRRTLPWEIDLFGDNATRPRPVPWMALLVFHPGEAPTVGTDRLSTVRTTTANGPRVPQLTVTPIDADPLVTSIEIDATTFRSALPHRADLPWLAHVREVRTDGKELLGMSEDGAFSVVIANRLPVAGDNVVHLVSLEGWTDEIVESSERSGPRPFRMISLASWTFRAKADRGSFGEKMQAIDAGPLRAGRSHPATDPGATPTEVEAAAIVSDAVSSGFVPLRYDMRHGERTVAWYRGPLTPAPVPRTDDRGPLPAAEAGLVYHPNIGMFDASYAVAWQIGRLLALSDAAFAGELMRWRQSAQAHVDRLLASELARERHAQIDAFAAAGELEQRIRIWRAKVAAEDPEADEERRTLEEDLRSLVLRIWDPDSIATSIARFATDGVFARLVDDDVLPAAPDEATRLRVVR